MKARSFFKSRQNSQQHRAIAPLIGFDFRVESGGRWELKAICLHEAEGALANVVSVPLASRAPTAKAKAIAEIALVVQFVPGLGLSRRTMKADSIGWNRFH
jgi:hypothetical protein